MQFDNCSRNKWKLVDDPKYVCEKGVGGGGRESMIVYIWETA